LALIGFSLLTHLALIGFSSFTHLALIGFSRFLSLLAPYFVLLENGSCPYIEEGLSIAFGVGWGNVYLGEIEGYSLGLFPLVGFWLGIGHVGKKVFRRAHTFLNIKI
jgi:hypothetical protein